MGFWTRLLGGSERQAEKAIPFDTYDAAQRVLPDPYEPFQGFPSNVIPVADPGVPLAELRRAGVAHFWRTQPNVRKVVDFIARNVASIPLHCYERVSDGDRRRVRDGAIPDALGSPQRGVSPFRFWRAVISDGLLYDRWAVLMVDTATGVDLVQIPSWRLRLETDALRRVSAAWYWVGKDTVADGDRDGWRPLDLDSLIFDHGYAPMTAGLTPIETLIDVLNETSEAVKYRRQVWANGARVPAWIERPPSEWSPEARERFRRGFRDSYTGDGENAGGVPILEDGMKLHALDAYPSKDTQDLEGRKLSAVEVASAWHIAPELIGAREGNYSNIEAFRQMLYRDSLGPYITAWEGALNAQLVPKHAGGRRIYVEAHLEAKLRGSFEEQAKVLSSAIGAPWMLREKGRARMNLPHIDGADELVVPLNVLVGGQASPRDSGSQNLNARGAKSARPRGKAATQAQADQVERVLAEFFARQGRSVVSAIGAGDYVWDAERWDRELADDLLRVSHTLASILGPIEAQRLGYPEDYDPDQTVNFLRKVAEDRARGINATTMAEIDAALAADSDPAAVFEMAENDRARTIGLSVATFAAGFAAVEAGKQIRANRGGRPTKTWLTGVNPRPSHAAVDGETVDIDATFSNGMEWPGQGGDPDDAGCNCGVQINYEPEEG